MTQKTVTRIVDETQTADKIGSGAAPVFATPSMIALMEQAALELAQTLIAEGETTVGTHVNVAHLSATPVGLEVSATATLLKQEGKLFYFSVTASDKHGLIGEGTHTRAAVNVERFLTKTNMKIQ